jgi:glutathione S-transferase
MSNLKPIHVWSHASGPNPWKVVIILEELGVPYETEYVDFSTIHDEPFISINPNGRVPAIKDPNNKDIIVWESGACVDYLLDTYDKEGKLSVKESPQKYAALSWRDFQMSGQGPYYGQLAWFKMVRITSPSFSTTLIHFLSCSSTPRRTSPPQSIATASKPSVSSA